MFIVEETDNRFYLKQSTLPNAGLGCFAKVPIKKGDYLEVIGVLVRKKSVADLCTHYANRYKFEAREKGDCHIIPCGYGGMVNQANNPDDRNVELRLTKLMGRKRSEHAGEVIYMALRDIQKDEELLGYYGENAGKEVQWAAEAGQIIDQNEEDWTVFLSYDLYNLGILQERL